MLKYSIIIPTLNEAENITPLLSRLQPLNQRTDGVPEIIFVDDGSSDGTPDIISAYTGPLNTRLVCRENQRGLAGAVVAGAKAATGEIVVVMDGDLSHPPETIPMLLEKMISGGYDMVIGSRYVEGGTTEGWPWSRRIASLLASSPARLLTGVKDPLAGFFAVRQPLLAAVTTGLDGFKIGLELLTGGLAAAEVPIRFVDRSRGLSKMAPATVACYLRQLLRICLRHSVLRRLLVPLLAIAATGAVDAVLLPILLAHNLSLDVAHIGSFLIAATLYFFLARSHDNDCRSRCSRHRGGYLTLVLLALWLRGGIIAMPALQAGMPSVSQAAALGATTAMLLVVCNLLAPRIFSNPTNWQFLGSLLIGYSLVLRVLYLGDIELLQEEAYYWNYAQHPAAGYLDHPPMVALLIRLGTLLFGNSEFGVRIGAVLCWSITVFFSSRLAGDIFDQRTGFGAAILLATLPIFFGTGLLLTPDAPLIASWAGALWYLHRALIRERVAAWLGCGLWLGLGMASKYTIALLGPAILLFMIVDQPARKWLTRSQPYLAAILALLIFSPVIWWNYQHDWVSFLFQSRDRIMASSSSFNAPWLLASIIALLSPLGIWLAAGTMTSGSLRQAMENGSPLGRSYRFALIMVLLPLAVFALFSLSRGVKLNWTGPIWLAILPFMARMLLQSSSAAAFPRCRAGLLPASLIALVLIYGTVLHYAALGLPGISFGNRSNLLLGWDDLARQVDDRIGVLTATGHSRPLVAGMDRYRLASGLAFYRSKYPRTEPKKKLVAETTGRQLFGRSALMYEFWHPQERLAGRDVLVLARSRDQLEASGFGEKYRPLGEIGQITVTKRGKKAGRYYYRLLTWYTPQPASDRVVSPVSPGPENRLDRHTVQVETSTTFPGRNDVL